MAHEIPGYCFCFTVASVKQLSVADIARRERAAALAAGASCLRCSTKETLPDPGHITKAQTIIEKRACQSVTFKFHITQTTSAGHRKKLTLAYGANTHCSTDSFDLMPDILRDTQTRSMPNLQNPNISSRLRWDCFGSTKQIRWTCGEAVA